MPMSRASNKNSRKNTGAINTEETPDNLCVLIELPRLLTQVTPWLISFGVVTGTGNLDWLCGCSIRFRL